jgi:hypothetical protein
MLKHTQSTLNANMQVLKKNTMAAICHIMSCKWTQKALFFGGGIFTATLIRSSRVARSLFVPALHYRSFVGGVSKYG